MTSNNGFSKQQVYTQYSDDPISYNFQEENNSPTRSNQNYGQNPVKFSTIGSGYESAIPSQPLEIQVNPSNIRKFINLFNKYNYISPQILSQFTTSLQMPTSPRQNLLKKNDAYLKTDMGPLAFSNLLDRFYLKATPQHFQQRYTKFTWRFNKLYDLYFWGFVGYIFLKRRAARKYIWYKLTRPNTLFFTIFYVAIPVVFITSQLYMIGLKRICEQNVQIMDAVFQTHLKMIRAHGVDIAKAIQFYNGDKQQQIIANKHMEFKHVQHNYGKFISVEYKNQYSPDMSNSSFLNGSQVNNPDKKHQNFAIINSGNVNQDQQIQIPAQILYDSVNQSNHNKNTTINQYTL